MHQTIPLPFRYVEMTSLVALISTSRSIGSVSHGVVIRVILVELLMPNLQSAQLLEVQYTLTSSSHGFDPSSEVYRHKKQGFVAPTWSSHAAAPRIGRPLHPSRSTVRANILLPPVDSRASLSQNAATMIDILLGVRQVGAEPYRAKVLIGVY